MNDAKQTTGANNLVRDREGLEQLTVRDCSPRRRRELRTTAAAGPGCMTPW
jgi:hypothetical protein